jgi:chemotaxis response regulator CheB
MDVELPGMGGVDAVEAIMRVHPVPILVLSSRAGQGDGTVEAAYLAGAAGAAGASDRRRTCACSASIPAQVGTPAPNRDRRALPFDWMADAMIPAASAAVRTTTS